MIENIKSWWKYNVYHKYLDFKRGISNLIKFFPIVWRTADWDYHYLLVMQKFQLEQLMKCLENGNEVDEDRLPKIEDIKRCIQLLDNIMEDKYAERCGYNSDRVKIEFVPIEKVGDEQLYEMVNKHLEPQSNEELGKIFKKAHALKEKEWKELWDTLKKGNKGRIGLNGWWD